jgi:predicted TIM-barrel fold metal-dependent hydrolase
VGSIAAIDVMNHPVEAERGLGGDVFQYEEFKIMLRTTFKAAAKPRPPQTPSPDAGAPRPQAEGLLVGHASVAELVADMDALGYDRIVITATKMWSYRYHHKLILDYSIDDVGRLVAESKGRIIGAASYNPWRIEESLAEVERGVREHGFKYVWFHPLSFGLAPNDRRFYPLYAKCNELDIAVGMQVGHSAEVLPSDVGRPMLADDVAIDFPNLRINLSHTGWPWIDEWCSMLWRHPNVYGDISAYYPRSLDERQVRFMDSSRGRNKVLFGTNGLGLKTCLEQFNALPIKEETKRRVLRDNAIEFLKLA